MPSTLFILNDAPYGVDKIRFVMGILFVKDTARVLACCLLLVRSSLIALPGALRAWVLSILERASSDADGTTRA